MEAGQQTPEGMMHVGQRILAWEVDEYPRFSRTRRWYVLASLAGAALILYAIATANFLFAVIVLMMGVIILVSTFKEPNRIPVIVTTAGIVVGDAFHDYRSIQDFSIAYQPPTVKQVYVSFRSVLQPLIAIPLEAEDPNEVRETLLAYIQENLDRTDETLTDRLRRVYKL